MVWKEVNADKLLLPEWGSLDHYLQAQEKIIFKEKDIW